MRVNQTQERIKEIKTNTESVPVFGVSEKAPHDVGAQEIMG
tara:strand:+ start:1678 stop:1800 length:123 start_codon:yes stop_codon:yes gene_type:complete